jgi:hypothetical protein
MLEGLASLAHLLQPECSGMGTAEMTGHLLVPWQMAGLEQACWLCRSEQAHQQVQRWQKAKSKDSSGQREVTYSQSRVEQMVLGD